MIEELRIYLKDVTQFTVVCPGKQEGQKSKECGMEITIDLTKKVDWTGFKCPLLKDVLERDLSGAKIHSTSGDFFERKMDLEIEREFQRGQSERGELP